MRKTIRAIRVVIAARRIQDFLWSKPGRRAAGAQSVETWETWERNLTKRIVKLSEVTKANRSWPVEAKKRLLQLATVALAMAEAIDAGAIEPRN